MLRDYYDFKGMRSRDKSHVHEKDIRETTRRHNCVSILCKLTIFGFAPGIFAMPFLELGLLHLKRRISEDRERKPVVCRWERRKKDNRQEAKARLRVSLRYGDSQFNL